MTYSPEQAAHFEALVKAINKAIIETSDPLATTEVDGAVHAVVSYSPDIVMDALVSAAASVGVQSGDYLAPKARRELADELRKVFLREWGAYERLFARVMAGISRQ